MAVKTTTATETKNLTLNVRDQDGNEELVTVAVPQYPAPSGPGAASLENHKRYMAKLAEQRRKMN